MINYLNKLLLNFLLKLYIIKPIINGCILSNKDKMNL